MRQYTKQFIASSVLLCSFISGVAAVQPVDQTTSLAVNYIYETTAVKGAKVEIYQVAQLDKGHYTLTEQFQELDVDFATLTSPSDWRDEEKALATFIDDQSCSGDTCNSTNSIGRVTFDNLDQGVYYVEISQATISAGTLTATPVLLVLPSYCDINDCYLYDVEMEPKAVLTPKPPSTPRPNRTPSPTPTPSATPTPMVTPTPTPGMTPTPSIITTPEPTPTPSTTPTPPPTGTPGPTPTPSVTPTPGITPTPSMTPTPGITPTPSMTPTPTPTPTPTTVPGPKDPPIAQTGSSAWLILPLALIGGGLCSFSVFGLRDKRREHEK